MNIFRNGNRKLNLGISERASRDLIWSLSADDFPLPSLGLRLHALLDEVLTVAAWCHSEFADQRWTRREAAIAFRIGVHLGHLRMQNAAGHLLAVKDLGRSSDDRGDLRRANARLFIPTRATWLVCYACKSRNPVACRVWSRPRLSSTRFAGAGPTSSEFCSIRSKQIDAVKSRKAAALIFRSRFLTGIATCFLQSISDSTLNRLAAFPESNR